MYLYTHTCAHNTQIHSQTLMYTSTQTQLQTHACVHKNILIPFRVLSPPSPTVEPQAILGSAHWPGASEHSRSSPAWGGWARHAHRLGSLADVGLNLYTWLSDITEPGSSPGPGTMEVTPTARSGGCGHELWAHESQQEHRDPRGPSRCVMWAGSRALGASLIKWGPHIWPDAEQGQVCRSGASTVAGEAWEVPVTCCVPPAASSQWAPS